MHAHARAHIAINKQGKKRPGNTTMQNEKRLARLRKNTSAMSKCRYCTEIPSHALPLFRVLCLHLGMCF